MTAEASKPRTCQTCGKPEDNHPYRHAFVGVGDSPALIEVRPPTLPPPDGQVEENSQARVRVLPPGDSVLRLALMRAGVISVEDLEKVEAELKGAGVAYHDPETLG